MSEMKDENRALSMVLDFIIMSLIAALFFLPGILTGVYRALANPDETGPFVLITSGIYFTVMGFVLIFVKDSFNGRSIAKRMLGLQVVDAKSGEAASPLQCLVRNMTFIIWPTEVIAIIVNAESRLGDKLAGTRVAAFEPVEPKKHRWDKIFLATGMCYFVIAALVYPLIEKMQALDEKWLAQPDPIEEYQGRDDSSLNAEMSKKLEAIVATEFPNYDFIKIEFYAQDLGNDQHAYIDMGVVVACELIYSETAVFEDTDRIKTLILDNIPNSSLKGGITFSCFENGEWSTTFKGMSITTYPNESP